MHSHVPSPPSSPLPYNCVSVDLSQDHTSNSYDIIIGSGLLDDVGSLIRDRLGRRRCLIVSDHHVEPLFAARCGVALGKAGHGLLPIAQIPAGEGSKSFQELQTLLDHMLKFGVDRKTLIVALGGGVVGDLAGCAASLVMRGLDVVQIPTTLLAQVDSSVGGKTGIDTAYGKNTVGTFHQPRLVVADVALLDTLPPRQLRAGYAEVVKYGLIRDTNFFEWCLKNGPQLLVKDRAALMHAVELSCRHKSEIVASDEKESGVRALLNLGHTFGHALETSLGYGETLLHGEAVAIGCVMAFQLSARLGMCTKAEVEIVKKHFLDVGLPVVPPKAVYDCGRLVDLMSQDKKAEAGKLTLILTRGLGQAFVAQDVDRDALRQIWQEVLP